MLKPSYFYGKTDTVIKYYQDLEDYLLGEIARFLIAAGEIGGSADRNIFILQQMGMSNAEITERLAILTHKSRNQVRKILQESVMTSFSNDREVIERYITGDIMPLNNPVIVAAMDAEWKKTQGELENLTMTTMQQYNKDIITLLNEAEIRVASGTQSYTTAVCEVLDNYAKHGMIVEYPTGASRTLEAAVRCCIVTAMNQTAAQVTNQYIAQGGIEYVLVSAHLGARHSDKGGLYSHDLWQGKVYKIRGTEDGIPNLLEATGYDIDPATGNGTVVNPNGLHGYNCRHSHQPWDKDLHNPWTDKDGKCIVDPAESQEVYEKQQKQRAMERAVRQTKRQLLMKQVEIDGVAETDEKTMLQPEYDRLAYRLREQNQKYKQFCADNGLQTQTDRIKVAGFKRAQAEKANGRATAYKNEQYREYETELGKNMVSKSEFARIMSDRAEKKLFTHYSDAIKRGDVSPLADYGLYRKTAMELQDKCVGLTTSNGVKLEKRSLHCIDRVIGSVEQRRNGITVDDVVNTLTSPDAEVRPIRYSKTAASQKFIYKNAEVTINPITKTLIQVNPHHREK